MQGSESYRLIVRRGPQPNQVYELTDEVVNLGRDITNNIVINDREVSRHHLRFTRGAEGFTMEDLGSTNGTFINGRRVTGASLLKPGDMIGLGETVTLSYDIARGGVPAAPPAAQQPPAAAPYQPPAQQYQPSAAQQPPAAAPYQPPAQPQYQPPAAQQPPQPDPYQQPYQQQPAGAGQQQYPAPGGGYPPSNDPYAQQPAAYADPYAQQAYSPPPPPGYGYDQHDPFGMREEEGTSTTRIILIGCGVLMLLCCCCTLVGVVAVDQLCLYDKIPFLSEILRALGIVIKCGA